METGSLSCEAHATSTAAQIQQLLDELTARREVSDARSRRQISQTLLPVLYWGQLQQGDMLLVHRKKDMSGVPGLGDIDHYGIFTGQDWPTGPAVVHWAPVRSGMVHTRFQVQVTPLSLFVRDSGMESVFVVKPSESFDPKTVLFRALVVVDFQGYNVFFNNCEHFARWAKTGILYSKQSDRFKVEHPIMWHLGALFSGGSGVPAGGAR